MENKQKVQELKKYIYLIKELDILMQSYVELRAKLTVPKTSQLKDVQVQTSTKNNMAESLAKLCNLDKAIDEIRKNIVFECTKIENMINQVESPNLRLILRLRYISDLPWENICKELNYSWKQIHRLHTQALNLIKDDTQ